MESLKIRPALRTDCPAIHKLIKELSEHKALENEFTVKVEDLELNGFDHEPPYFSGVVAEMPGKDTKNVVVIGVSLYHLKYSTWEGPVMHVNTFVVSSKHRRKGVGTKLLKTLAKISIDKKYTRISLEVFGSNESGLSFFKKNGALNLTKEEGWLNYYMSPDTTKKITELSKEVENVVVRPTEPKDCNRIQEMIQELAEFEKMPDGPKLGVKDLQRNGFYKLYPDFYSFVAELEDPETGEKEIVGFTLCFLTFNPFKGRKIHLEDLYVTPKHRTKGIGVMLFQSVAKFANTGEYSGFTLEVLDWNTKAIQFYDKFEGVNMTTSSKAEQSFRFRLDAIKLLASTI